MLYDAHYVHIDCTYKDATCRPHATMNRHRSRGVQSRKDRSTTLSMQVRSISQPEPAFSQRRRIFPWTLELAGLATFLIDVLGLDLDAIWRMTSASMLVG